MRVIKNIKYYACFILMKMMQSKNHTYDFRTIARISRNVWKSNYFFSLDSSSDMQLDVVNRKVA